MSGKFADSNVALYLTSGDDARRQQARSIFDGDIVVSVQVLNEVAHVFRRKWKRSWDETLEFLDLLGELTTAWPVEERTHFLGVRMAQRHNLQVHDGMIVAAALIAGCDVLYSEDMHHGLLVENQLRIVNPFLPN